MVVPKSQCLSRPARSAAVLRVMLLGVRSRSMAFDVAPSFLMVSSECFWSSFNLEMV